MATTICVVEQFGLAMMPWWFCNGLGIHFRNHQRHLRVHPPVAAFVDDDAVALDGPGDEILGHRVGRAADRQVDAFERLGRQLLDRVLLAL